METLLNDSFTEQAKIMGPSSVSIIQANLSLTSLGILHNKNPRIWQEEYEALYKNNFIGIMWNAEREFVQSVELKYLT